MNPVATVVILLAMLSSIHAQDDLSPPLYFGTSTALSGPSGALGQDMRLGIEAAFDECNTAGGINGRKLRLVVLDDGYEPTRTVPNMTTLIEKVGVLGVIGNVGTPTAIAAIPIATENKVPFIAAYTGAGVLRKSPPDRYVINYRASYAQETQAMVDALIHYAGCKPNEIAFFTQRDGYGDAGFIGGIEALRSHGYDEEHKVPHVRYTRNTLSVESALAELMLLPTPPKAVIMAGAYAPSAKFIKLARSVSFNAIFLNISSVGSYAFAQQLGTAGEGVIITQVMPPPESNLPIAKEFRVAYAQISNGAPLTFGAFEGYVSTRMLILALQSCDERFDRESIIESLERLGNFDLGLNSQLSLSPQRHQASDHVWPTVVRSGKVQPFNWEELSAYSTTD
ncbi:ABC transporter substrate-binding protein [Stieleria sp. JC731]|nr:ABC transporter substrate-binding protein [Stieleria sp. JC731]MCC9601686.1 ABC transporter substrate-binding protein [Stieleria sp. JC731]